MKMPMAVLRYGSFLRDVRRTALRLRGMRIVMPAQAGIQKQGAGQSSRADALAIVTEWQEFRSPDFPILKQQLSDAVIFDGRNLYDPKRMAELGFEYHSIGRPSYAMVGSVNGVSKV